MRKVVQIKGANGTGKTTIIKQLIANSSDVTVLTNKLLYKRPYATVLHDLEWVVIGHYPETAKGGGADNINKMETLKRIITVIAEDFPDYWIVVEGAMVSTTMTLYNFFLEIGEQPCIVILNTTLAGCLRRLEKRKGDGVKLDENSFSQLQPKIDRIPKQKHDPKHVEHMDVDTLPEEEMVWEFLAAVGWRV